VATVGVVVLLRLRRVEEGEVGELVDAARDRLVLAADRGTDQRRRQQLVLDARLDVVELVFLGLVRRFVLVLVVLEVVFVVDLLVVDLVLELVLVELLVVVLVLALVLVVVELVFVDRLVVETSAAPPPGVRLPAARGAPRTAPPPNR